MNISEFDKNIIIKNIENIKTDLARLEINDSKLNTAIRMIGFTISENKKAPFCSHCGFELKLYCPNCK